MSYNDITGDRIASRVNNKKYSEGWDGIFKKPEPKITPFFDKEKCDLITKTGSEALQEMLDEKMSGVLAIPSDMYQRIQDNPAFAREGALKAFGHLNSNTTNAAWTNKTDSEILKGIFDTRDAILNGFDKKREI